MRWLSSLEGPLAANRLYTSSRAVYVSPPCLPLVPLYTEKAGPRLEMVVFVLCLNTDAQTSPVTPQVSLDPKPMTGVKGCVCRTVLLENLKQTNGLSTCRRLMLLERREVDRRGRSASMPLQCCEWVCPSSVCRSYLDHASLDFRAVTSISIHCLPA